MTVLMMLALMMLALRTTGLRWPGHAGHDGFDDAGIARHWPEMTRSIPFQVGGRP
jgi:hypothetical protein